MLFETGRLKMQ